MAIQDDAREIELIELFELGRPIGGGRSGTDAILEIDGNVIPFELKSSTVGSVSTARDIGPEHLARWRAHHWLIGFYSKSPVKLLHCYYGSPELMAPWIDKIEAKIVPDIELSLIAPERLTLADLYRVLGEKEKYTLADARSITKSQRGHGSDKFVKQTYLDLMDRPSGFSAERMLSICRDRCRYLIRRGATLNNEHIPEKFISTWEKVTSNHAERLRELVRAAI